MKRMAMTAMGTAMGLVLLGAGPALACSAHPSHAGDKGVTNAGVTNAPAGELTVAQTRGEGGTIREEENRRSGGTGTGGSDAPAPDTVRPRDNSQGGSRGDTQETPPTGTLTPQGNTTGPGQNQGSPPGTSSGSGTSGAPSTTNGSTGEPSGNGSGSGGSGGSGN